MTQYIDDYVNISEGQVQFLKQSIDTGCAVTSLRLKKDDLDGDHKISFTKAQHDKLEKARKHNKGVTFRLSKKQLKHTLQIEGEFLGLLAGLAARALPAIAKTVLPALGVGALSGLAQSGIQKAMGNGLYLKKGGCICKVETDGSGLYLKPYKGNGLKGYGEGLYLKQGGKLYDGQGLLLGANSPFKNIPILGAIL